MYTQCPECLTYFQVTPEHLKIAQGNVRCGQCRNVFSALGNLTEQPPASAYQTSPGSLSKNNGSEDIIEEEVANKSRANSASRKSTSAVKQNTRAKAVNNLKKNSTTTNPQPKPQPKANTAAAKPVAPAVKAKPAVTKTKAKATKTSPNQKATSKSTPENKVENKSRLGHAIDAIKALNKSGPKKLSSLEAGRDSYIGKIKENIKKEVKKRVDPQNKKPAANTLKSKKATKPNNAAPAAAPPVKPRKANQSPAPSQPKTSTKQPAVDLDQVFQDIDNLDIGGEKFFTNAKTTGRVNDKNADVKNVKILPNNQADNDKPRQNQLATSSLTQGKSLTIIPKQLVDDFRGVAAQQQPIPHNPLNILWNIGSILLMVVFLIQTIYFKHNDLAKSPQLRPWIESLCEHLACDLSLPSEIKKLELLGQDIRSHPKQKKALLVSTTIINNAGYTQSYPILEITFSNMNGEKIAMRRFLAAEYLPANTEIEKGMRPNTPIKIELGMLDPGVEAVNFEFDFLPAT